ncbi:valine--tRNA ligase [Marinicella litoralis]|uniref:Valine--tRNA ligase n=1 Tax=Marinicella litoralis TaxID=644220 RepID=A0A4R6XTK8_9GAMM|nr:valine--tRNA ligase [Marinicella litoralis]TDR20783.1 valyl-tRNA synthetase [Marinicella litoralis]
MIEKYDPTQIETKWYQNWEKNGYFKAGATGNTDSDETYCIMIPPPNVTGTLHMGHAFQDTIMDTLIRYHRMQGKNTLWQPGTDHAGIATQMVVERQLNAQGSSRVELGREAFVDQVWQWKEQSGNTITNQLRRMGASPDWSRQRFTMDDGMSAAVMKVFVDLHEEGLIYRGQRLVNWDPTLNTALSDLEVESVEENGFMWHFNYPVADDNGDASDVFLTIATTRPETLLGDTAVAVNPDDDRFKHLIGQQVLLPICNRLIPIVGDQHADPEKGTGCVKITPAHDFNDYQVGQRHDLPLLNVLNFDATINKNAPEAYQGLPRYDARKAVVAEMDRLGLLVETKPHTLMVPRGDRSGDVIEPMLTNQWYVDAKTLAKPAIEAVDNGDIKFVPDNWKNTYYAWMNDIQDWCISRQLWWGHRIPAWYDEQDNIYVGMDEADARARHNLTDEVKLRQDNDVLDTWFSSALWPFATLDWPENSKELQTYYPTNVLVTGFDIIFFWVARMIMMGMKFMDNIPFKEVYIHGLVRDSNGQKMSKSKGNVLDPIDLIDGISLEALLQKRTQGLMQDQPKKIEQIKQATMAEFPEGIKPYGCDAMRFTFASLASTGRDINFDMGRVEGYRNFCNKIFNASRFVFMNTEDHVAGEFNLENASTVEKWIVSRLQNCIIEYRRHMDRYRLDLASQAIYDFFWNEYCDWFLELSKPLLKTEQKAQVQGTLLYVLDQALRLLHPIMPYVTEEIWQEVKAKFQLKPDSIMISSFPIVNKSLIDDQAEAEIKWIKTLTLAVRQIRGEMNIPPSKKLTVLLSQASEQDQSFMQSNLPLLKTMARLEALSLIQNDQEEPPAATALMGEMKILIPLAGLIDKTEESKRINKQIDKINQEIKRAEGKLNNEKFVNKAPDHLVAAEKAKLESNQVALQELNEQLEKLDKL